MMAPLLKPNVHHLAESASTFSVLLVAPVPPPYGGMALQAQSLCRLLESEGLTASIFASNFELSSPWHFFSKVPVARTALRALFIWSALVKPIRSANTVHIFAASWLYFFLVVYPALIIARLCGRKAIINYRGGEAKPFFQNFGWLARGAFRLADTVIAPSDFLANLIRSTFSVDVQIVPNILDLSAFSFYSRERLQPRLLIARHLEEIYGIDVAVRAFALFQKKYPSASLLIAGSGSMEQSLKVLVGSLGVQNVEFLGQVPQDRLPQIYRECDIYLNASTVDNFPAALLQASAAGLAVVSTCPGGIPFIYENEWNALLVEPHDWQGLATALERILNDSQLTKSLISRGRLTAEACCWQAVRCPLFSAYGFDPPNGIVRDLDQESEHLVESSKREGT